MGKETGLEKITLIGELGQAGLNPWQIAEQMGLSLLTVQTYMSEARAMGLPAAARKTNRSGSPVLTVQICRDLSPHAKARGVSVAKLAAMILEKVGSDGLVDAVLDDGEAPE